MLSKAKPVSHLYEHLWESGTHSCGGQGRAKQVLFAFDIRNIPEMSFWEGLGGLKPPNGLVWTTDGFGASPGGARKGNPSHPEPEVPFLPEMDCSCRGLGMGA